MDIKSVYRRSLIVGRFNQADSFHTNSFLTGQHDDKRRVKPVFLSCNALNTETLLQISQSFLVHISTQRAKRRISSQSMNWDAVESQDRGCGSNLKSVKWKKLIIASTGIQEPKRTGRFLRGLKIAGPLTHFASLGLRLCNLGGL